ncbi:hypothetical protein [Flavobacterium sp.]|uniref:hypothetical protein n=1 Tax=Flavobacterium sp. TaxID=239 RepID=UPI003753BE62
MKKLKVSFIVLFTSILGVAQNGNYQPKTWGLMGLNGGVELYGQYKDSYTSGPLGENKETNFLYSGKFLLNAQSYFWHPNFLVLDIEAEYNPGAGQDASILMPDYAIVNSGERLNVAASLFREKKIKLRPFLSYNNVYSNYENLSEYNATYFNWGSHFSFNNKWLPLTVTYKNSKDENQEKYTNRHYKNTEEEIVGTIEKSIGKRDQNVFNFSQRYYTYELVDVYENENKSTNLNLRNDIAIDKNKDYKFSSLIYKIYQTGTNPFDRLNFSENLTINLPWHLRFNTRFGYSEGHQDEQFSKNRDIEADIQHQWYESLNTAVFFKKGDYGWSNSNATFNRAGFNIGYTKKVPLKGKLSLNYNYSLQDQQGSSGTSDISVFKEPYTLVDGKITLLRNPNVYIESVLVTDATASLIYQENIDYILIQRDAFIEIQRIPGGLIPNNTTVYIDYTAKSLGVYSYKLDANIFMGMLNLFDNLLEINYKYLHQDYRDVAVTNDLVLQYINQKLYGFKLNYQFVNIGIEHDDFKSNVVPYRLTRYFANLQGSLKDNKLSYTLNGNYTNYHMIGEEGRKQKFVDVAMNLTYNFNYKTHFDLRAGYRIQEGEGIDLNLFLGSAKLATIYKQIIVELSADLYRRETLAIENHNFNAIKLKIIRRF